MSNYTVKVEKNLDNNKRDYHLYKNGRFVMTFWSRQSVNKYIQMCKEEEE